MKTDIKKHENGGAKSWIKAHLSDIIPVLGLILVLVFFNAVSGGKVFTKTNFNTLFNEASMMFNALIALGVPSKMQDVVLGVMLIIVMGIALNNKRISGFFERKARRKELMKRA